jgi:hypothetical protein
VENPSEEAEICVLALGWHGLSGLSPSYHVCVTVTRLFSDTKSYQITALPKDSICKFICSR